MSKGFIFFREGKIPFVIEDYCMELFTDDGLLKDFLKEYNYKSNYILKGQCFDNGIHAQSAIFLVERSLGSRCYLKCYIVGILDSDSEFDSIGLQSLFLDDVFRYNYKYMEFVRAGVNLAEEPKEVYRLSFSMEGNQYAAVYRMGFDNHRGLLDDRERKGEFLVPVYTGEIQETYNLAMVFYRLAMFIMSYANVPFKRIVLYKKGRRVGWFFCPLVSKDAISGSTVPFYEFDVMKYVPKILRNIATDFGNKITKSIPLGHLSDFDNLVSPHRFMEQIMAFEYLFDKLESKKANDRGFSLKQELKVMFDEFPELLLEKSLSSESASERIKTMRNSIAHGHVYYYDFKNDSNAQYLFFLLDKLIRKMSLLWIGFTKEEIARYPVCW